MNLPDYAANLLQLHGYHWKWVPEGKSFAIWKMGDTPHSFIMSGDESPQDWLDTVEWYDERRSTDKSAASIVTPAKSRMYAKK